MAEIVQPYGVDIDSPELLSDDDIISKIIPKLSEVSNSNPNCTDNDKILHVSYACFFISGHGDDLEVGTRSTIIDSLYENNFVDILVRAGVYTNDSFRDEFEKYITDSVNLQIAMGDPGPSAPMSSSDVSYYEKRDEIRKGNQLQYLLSTSEIDIAVVENAYRLLATTKVPNLADPAAPAAPLIPTKCDLIEFNKIIRHQLRANFMELWKQSEDSEDTSFDTEKMWEVHYQKLIQYTQTHPTKPKIWVQKKLNKYSHDRYYQLEPNAGEDPTFRVHEGLHLFYLLNNDGLLNTDLIDFDSLTEWKQNITIKSGRLRPSSLTTVTNDELDTNNLKNSAFREKFKKFVEDKIPALDSVKQDIIMQILDSIEASQLFLSEICLLGFLLGIKILTLFDPACRPVTSTSLTEATTKSGKKYRTASIYGKQAKKIEEMHQFLEVLSQEPAQP